MTLRPTTAVLAVAVLLATAVAAAACGNGDPEDRSDAAAGGPDPADARDEPTTTPAAPRSGPPPTLGAPGRPPATPTDGLGGTRTVSGTVTEVAGCLVLDAGGVRWALVGEIAGVTPGAEVTVTGRPTGDVDDTCGDAILRVTGVNAR